jgi:hypothetical protein
MVLNSKKSISWGDRDVVTEFGQSRADLNRAKGERKAYVVPNLECVVGGD